MCLPPHLLKYTTHLRRHTAKKYPQRIIDTPAVLFCLIPCICIVYFKRLTEGASTASHGKKVSSTYQRYACGTFLPNSLYLHRLFSKALEIRRICVVASQKTVLDVQKVRLRVFFVRS